MKLPIQTQPVQRTICSTKNLSQGVQDSKISAQECILSPGVNCGFLGCPDGYFCTGGYPSYCCKF